MNIIILNLPKDTEEEKLKSLFKPFGKVESLSLVMDERTGQTKGFGFVEMLDEEKAKKAIEGLHGTKIGKNKIRVKIAENQGSKPV